MSSSMGDRIQDYEVYDHIGKGGFASVYRAKCLKTGQDVAIKMIDKKQMQASGMVKRVEQEVSIHYRLKHPSILELHTFFEDENYVYLVLELCHNGELRQYIKSTRLAEAEVSSIMKQVVEGIKYLHAHNILHRDISLSNLLLTKDMRVKIADFGLATQLSRPDEQHLTMCGTPNFISPEVASRSSHGLEADIWGLGCLLYTLLVGSPPFDTQGVKSTLNRIVTAAYHLPNHLSFEAKDLINSLLQKNPKERIKLDEILEHPFIKRGPMMTSHLTQDSGIHTMSSRRESAFSDSALPHLLLTSQDHQQNAANSRKTSHSANSDCLPFVNRLTVATGNQHQHPFHPHPHRLTQSMEHLNKNKLYDGCLNSNSSNNNFNNCGEAILLERRCCSVTSSCHGHRSDHPSQVFSLDCCGTGSRCETKTTNSQCCHHNNINIMDGASTTSTHRSGQCNQNRYHPADPGGGGTGTNQILASSTNTNNNHNNNNNNLNLPLPQSPSNNNKKKNKNNYEIEKGNRQLISGASSNSNGSSDQKKSSEVKTKGQRLLQLCSHRLLPKSHRTENSILHILADGEVVVELMRKRGKLKKTVVCEVIRISSDGSKITIYEPNGGKGVPPSSSGATPGPPPPLPPQGGYQSFGIENLPERHWNKYMHAYQFVALVKEKTPKVTVYSDKLKCVLMENLTDFEVTFYEGGSVTKSSLKGVTFVESSSGDRHNFTDPSECRNLTGTLEYMWNQSQEALKQCLVLEQTLSKVNGGQNFPAILGRRPTMASNCGKENQTHTAMPSFTVSMANATPGASFQSSTNGTANHHHITSSSSTSSTSSSSAAALKEKKAIVPGIGTAVQSPSGEVRVKYIDGTQLWMDGKHHIRFQYADGKMAQYLDNDTIPRPVREKLEQMPKILKHLMPSSVTHKFRL